MMSNNHALDTKTQAAKRDWMGEDIDQGAFSQTVSSTTYISAPWWRLPGFQPGLDLGKEQGKAQDKHSSKVCQSVAKNLITCLIKSLFHIVLPRGYFYFFPHLILINFTLFIGFNSLDAPVPWYKRGHCSLLKSAGSSYLTATGAQALLSPRQTTVSAQKDPDGPNHFVDTRYVRVTEQLDK